MFRIARLCEGPMGDPIERQPQEREVQNISMIHMVSRTGRAAVDIASGHCAVKTVALKDFLGGALDLRKSNLRFALPRGLRAILGGSPRDARPRERVGNVAETRSIPSTAGHFSTGDLFSRTAASL